MKCITALILACTAIAVPNPVPVPKAGELVFAARSPNPVFVVCPILQLGCPCRDTNLGQAKSEIEKRSCIPCVTYCCQQSGCNGYLHCDASFVCPIPELWQMTDVYSVLVINMITAIASVAADTIENEI